MAEIQREQNTQHEFELPGPMVVALRVVDRLKGLFMWLGRVESSIMRKRIDRTELDRPIYICGVPRCGTTITLEMLSRHPDLASHRYADMLMPYVPYAWNKIAPHIAKRIDNEPQERLHADRIKVTKLSPESAEELLWLPYFPQLHDEQRSCLLTKSERNPKFDRFYVDALKKLLLVHEKPRYLSKANYNTTRIAYLHDLLPSARFLLLLRHPVHHVASLIKQDEMLTDLAAADPRVQTMTRLTGHFDFGPGKVWQRVSDKVEEVSRLYLEGRRVRAWALHWADVYDVVFDQLRANPSLADATLVVRYEDLCEASDDVITKILEHCQLGDEGFSAVRAEFAAKLTRPTYYTPKYEPQELADIDEVTKETREKYGYSTGARDALADPPAVAAPPPI